MARSSRSNTVFEMHTAGCGVHWHILESVRKRHGAPAPFSCVYYGLIDTQSITVREIAENMNMPFDTFHMLPLWVGTDSDRVAVQNALRDVGTRIPYAAFIDLTHSWEQPGRRPLFSCTAS